ncbi:MAG: type II secretion system protein F [Candidatus Parcubacteria bacterium]|nr:MAG: type II secretion system protein F [Candidatus Parcubacteria bacterium]
MTVYHYKAYDYKGKLHTGNLFVPSEEEAIAFLLRNNLTPIEVKLVPQSLFRQFLLKLFFRITFSQKLYLLRSLYLILKSGLTLDKGLEVLIREAKGGVKDFLFYLDYNLQRGEPVYRTFAAFPQFFSQVEVETIRAGEISGNLVGNLEKLAENLERQREIKNEIISNIIYPAIVLGLAFGVIILLITFVMPRISVLLTQLTSKPPLLTRILIGASTFVNNNLSLVTTILILIILTFIFVVSLKKTRKILFKFLIRLPVLSNLYYALALSQSFFILRSLLSSGLNLTQSLKLAADASFHPYIRESFYDVEKELRAGKKLGDALLLQEKIPVFVSSILSVASEAGFLEETLRIMENYYLEEFRATVRNFLNLLQPALLIFVGGIVGFVAIAVLVPIYQQISQQLQFQEGRGQIPGEL